MCWSWFNGTVIFANLVIWYVALCTMSHLKSYCQCISSFPPVFQGALASQTLEPTLRALIMLFGSRENIKICDTFHGFFLFFFPIYLFGDRFEDFAYVVACGFSNIEGCKPPLVSFLMPSSLSTLTLPSISASSLGLGFLYGSSHPW